MMEPPEKPLAAKRIVVTRSPEQSGELIRTLEHLGAETILLPMVAFAVPEDARALDRALHELATFDWILFTSQNAVRFIALRLKQLGLPPMVQRIAAVGPATAEAARQQGFHVDYVATNHTARSLASELPDSLAGGRVLLPRSDRADDHIAEALRERGVQVTDVIAYRTIAPVNPDPAMLDGVRGGDFHVAIFSSPSAFHNMDGFLGAGTLAKLAEKVRYAAIGPTTAKAMRDAGVRVHIEAEEASSAGLADAIVKYFHEHSAPSRHS
ncbi:MAG: uroporphyrinogen-III synthase [Candidatus Acidiferrales bacterium]